jgi:hypothetical protein
MLKVQTTDLEDLYLTRYKPNCLLAALHYVEYIKLLVCTSTLQAKHLIVYVQLYLLTYLLQAAESFLIC